MELREFIKTALLDITGAVQDAQGETEAGTIVPGGISRSYKCIEFGISPVQAVEFEVCVGADEATGKEGKLGVISAIVGAGISGSSTKESSHTSTLKFRIPIKFPSSGTLD